MNDKYFRYILKETGLTTKEIADKIGISQQGLNKRIKNNKLYITDIFTILEMLNMDFEEVFKNK